MSIKEILQSNQLREHTKNEVLYKSLVMFFKYIIMLGYSNNK